MILRETITRYLKDLGVQANLNGYEYLREAIELAITDRTYLKAICRKLYPAVAEKFGTDAGSVERCIRFAIQKSILKGKYNLICEIFGSTIDPDRGVATNTEFIATLADYINMKEVSAK